MIKLNQVKSATNSELLKEYKQAIADQTNESNFRRTGVTPETQKRFAVLHKEVLRRMGEE